MWTFPQAQLRRPHQSVSWHQTGQPHVSRLRSAGRGKHPAGNYTPQRSTSSHCFLTRISHVHLIFLLDSHICLYICNWRFDSRGLSWYIPRITQNHGEILKFKWINVINRWSFRTDASTWLWSSHLLLTCDICKGCMWFNRSCPDWAERLHSSLSVKNHSVWPWDGKMKWSFKI